jgi:hypothetical protein
VNFKSREGLPASLAALRIAPMTSAAVFGLAGRAVACMVFCDRWRSLASARMFEICASESQNSQQISIVPKDAFRDSSQLRGGL